MSFSLRSLLLVIPVIALGVSGFVFSLPWATSLTYTICMAFLLFAAVAVLFTRGERRLFWAGFAAFGWGYWLLAFEGHEQSRRAAMRPDARFVTSHLINELERHRSTSSRVGSRMLAEWQGAYWPATIVVVDDDRYLLDWGDGSPQFWADASQVLPISSGPRQAAHSLFCLLFALVGATLAVRVLHDRTWSKKDVGDDAH
ncbi:MAG: hypothetical protein WD894_07940 [Pirellulales bacterium]